jgi:hypothetical protein
MFKYEFVECEYKSGFTDNLYVKATEILQQPNNLHETEAYKTWVNIQKDNWIKPVVLNVANISTIARARQKNLNYAEFITEVCTQIKNSATCQEIIFEDLDYGLGGLEISEDLIVDSICNSLETNKAIKIISITACPIKNVKKLLNLLSDNYTLSKLILDNNDFSYQQHQEIQAFIKTCKYPLILSLREKNELIPMSLIEEAQKNSNIRLCLNSTQLQSCFSEEYEENGRLKGCDITYLQRKQFYF